MHRLKSAPSALPNVEPPIVMSGSVFGPLVASVLGLAAAWTAAGSVGLLAHGLRHALTWVLVLFVIALAWPRGASLRQRAIVIAAAAAAVAMTATTNAVVNTLAVTLTLGALAFAHGASSGVVLLIAAQASGVLALFQFAQTGIASFWQVSNTIAGWVGRAGGAMAGEPLDVGATFAGLDFIVTTTALIGLLWSRQRLSVKAVAIGSAAMLAGHLAYVGVLAKTERILTAARTMRAERLLAMAAPTERKAILDSIRFEPATQSESDAVSTEEDPAARARRLQQAADEEVERLGLTRAELGEILVALANEASFPDWVDAKTRAMLLDRLKPSLDAFQRGLWDGPAARAPYTLDGFLLAVVPWNVPAVALIIHLGLAVGILRAAGWPGTRAAAAWPGSSEASPRNQSHPAHTVHSAPAGVLASLANKRPWLPAASLIVVGLLLPIAVIYSPATTAFRDKKIVAYEKGFLNWLKPEYGNMRDNANFGRLAAGMYGMVGPYLETLGLRFSRSQDLSSADLHDADVLVLFYPNRRWKESQLDRIEEFVRRGGSLLVAGEHTIHETKKKPGDIRYAGEEEDETLESGEAWAGEEEGNRVNDLLARFGLQIAFDSAEFAVGGWLQSYATLSHPATTGLRDERNAFGVVVGASVEAGWPARPMIIGRYGIGDLGDRQKAEAGSYMGDSRYNAGERLGDIVLACEKRVGDGRVVLFGDTSSFTNNLIVSGHPFTSRLYAYLASPGAIHPQTMWRQIIGGGLMLAALALLCVDRRGLGIAGFSIALSGAACVAMALTAWGNEILPSGTKYTPPADEVNSQPSDYRGPNNLAYIDEAHHSAASDESLRPDGIMGLTFMLARHNYVPLSLPELTGERLMHDPDKRDVKLGVDSLKARLVISIAPQREYTERECQIIDEYVARGGRFILAAGADDAGPTERLLERFGMGVGGYASPAAYGIATRQPVTTAPDNQASVAGFPEAFTPLVDQPAREATPLGHFKVPFAAMQDDLGVYEPYARFHAGWPVRSADRNTLVISRFTGEDVDEQGRTRRMELPLIVVKRHQLGLIALVGDTGFAMNKNLEREDGLPIDGMRENALFWRWFLDLLEHEVEAWRVPRQERPAEEPDLLQDMPLLAVPPLKTDAAPSNEARDEKGPLLSNPGEAKEGG